MDSPFGLLAELTYRCPLACAYCSNPLNMADYADELTTDEWRRVLAEARDLGVLQCHLSGGEPLLRRDLVEIVADAHDLGLYTNLVTSAARALAAEGRAAAGRRPGPRAGQHPGRRAGRVRPDRRHPVLPAQDRGHGRGQGAGLAAHRERGAAPAEHRPRRRRARAGRGGGRRPGGAGQHPVLRLGLAQPGRAAAEPGPARGGRGRRAGRPRAVAGPHGRHLRHPRLLQPLPEALHGRLGRPAADRDAERRRPALPGRPVPAVAAGQRARRTRWRGSGPSPR